MLSNIVWILTDKLENVLNKRNAHINTGCWILTFEPNYEWKMMALLGYCISHNSETHA